MVLKKFVIAISSVLLLNVSVNVFAQLTPEDLDKIRLIVKDEVKSEITPIDTRLQKVEQAVSRLDGRLDGIEKRITHSNNIMYALIALIIFAIGLPAWQNRKDREDKKKIEELTERLQTLEQQRIAN